MRRTMMILAGAMSLACLVTAMARSTPAATAAQGSPVTIDSREPTLEQQKGGGWTASLGFTNLTEGAITLTTKADSTGAVCGLTTDHAELKPAEHATATVTIPASCNVAKSFAFKVTATGATGATAPVTFAVSATKKPDSSKPEWEALWAFPILLVVLLLLAVVFFYAWRSSGQTGATQLKYLESTWSFKDSWVSNVTVAGALLTGIFGSAEIVTDLLGSEAKSAVALATVGAAAAAVFTGAGPILLSATKSKQGDFFTVGGLLAASAVTLTGALGEVWTVYRSGHNLDLDGMQKGIIGVAIAAALLLLLYAIRTTRATLNHGIEKPLPPPSDAVTAAELIVKALNAQQGADQDRFEGEFVAFAAEHPVVKARPEDDYPRPFRSALL